MAKFNKKNVENAPDKIKAGAEEMIKAPMWLIEQILLKHEKAVLEVMKELHDENAMLRNRETGHRKPWPQTMDAKIWADEFCKRNSASDHGTMLGWFANAIMIGYDTARWEFDGSQKTIYLTPSEREEKQAVLNSAMRSILDNMGATTPCAGEVDGGSKRDSEPGRN